MRSMLNTMQSNRKMNQCMMCGKHLRDTCTLLSWKLITHVSLSPKAKLNLEHGVTVAETVLAEFQCCSLGQDVYRKDWSCSWHCLQWKTLLGGADTKYQQCVSNPAWAPFCCSQPA